MFDRSRLDDAMADQDIVYANLNGDDIDVQANRIIASMQACGAKRPAWLQDEDEISYETTEKGMPFSCMCTAASA